MPNDQYSVVRLFRSVYTLRTSALTTQVHVRTPGRVFCTYTRFKRMRREWGGCGEREGTYSWDWDDVPMSEESQVSLSTHAARTSASMKVLRCNAWWVKLGFSDVVQFFLSFVKVWPKRPNMCVLGIIRLSCACVSAV